MVSWFRESHFIPDPRADPRHDGEIITLSWPGKALGFHQRSWWKWLRSVWASVLRLLPPTNRISSGKKRQDLGFQLNSGDVGKAHQQRNVAENQEIHWHQCLCPLAAMNSVTVWWTGLLPTESCIFSPFLVDNLLPLSSNPLSHPTVHSTGLFKNLQISLTFPLASVEEVGDRRIWAWLSLWIIYSSEYVIILFIK